jgi:hypothetical protein
MRDGEFEMLVLDENRRPIREDLLEGNWLIGSTVGTAFQVEVRYYPGNVPRYFFVELYIDGRYVNYQKLECLSATYAYTYVRFKGFVKSAGVFAFEFGEVKRTFANNPLVDAQIEIGTISVRIFETTPTKQLEWWMKPPKTCQAGGCKAAETGQSFSTDKKPVTSSSEGKPEPLKVEEDTISTDDKKFWKIPTLYTAVGKQLAPPYVHRAPASVVNANEADEAGKKENCSGNLVVKTEKASAKQEFKEDPLASKINFKWHWNARVKSLKVLTIHYQDKNLLQFTKAPTATSTTNKTASTKRKVSDVVGFDNVLTTETSKKNKKKVKCFDLCTPEKKMKSFSKANHKVSTESLDLYLN